MKEKKSMARRKMLDELRMKLREMMSKGPMDGMAVKVASDSPEGLKEGLDKAKEIIESKEESQDMDNEEQDYSNMSKEELVELLKDLKK